MILFGKEITKSNVITEALIFVFVVFMIKIIIGLFIISFAFKYFVALVLAAMSGRVLRLMGLKGFSLKNIMIISFVAVVVFSVVSFIAGFIF
jgi:hypothetical protein